jgi:hypothetical protein
MVLAGFTLPAVFGWAVGRPQLSASPPSPRREARRGEATVNQLGGETGAIYPSVTLPRGLATPSTGPSLDELVESLRGRRSS